MTRLGSLPRFMLISGKIEFLINVSFEGSFRVFTFGRGTSDSTHARPLSALSAHGKGCRKSPQQTRADEQLHYDEVEHVVRASPWTSNRPGCGPPARQLLWDRQKLHIRRDLICNP